MNDSPAKLKLLFKLNNEDTKNVIDVVLFVLPLKLV